MTAEAGATAANPVDVGNAARLISVTVADDPAAWEAAGFTVVEGSVTVGGTRIELVGRAEHRSERGIRGWTISGLDSPEGDGSIDGLPTTFAAAAEDPGGTAQHRNGTTGIDHVVVITPDLDRTISAFAGVGLAVRRMRETESYGAPMRQAFMRLGPVVLEVVGGHEGSGQTAEEAPADWFGLALDVADLDATATLLGEGLGGIKAAVQEGRRIATIRHREFGMSVATALMDDGA